MKIGVAFSGSGACAASAHIFADELRACAVPIEMLSVTSLTAVPVLLWSKGLLQEEIEELMDLFLQSPADAPALMERMRVLDGDLAYPVAVSSVDAASGVSVLYADGLRSDAWNLKVRPLSGNERRALQSTISPFHGVSPFSEDGLKLCDFSVRYGCPFFPLKMAGMERILAVSFAGGGHPAQIAADSLSALTGRNADLSYVVRQEGGRRPEEQIRAFVRERAETIYQRLLF